MSDFTDFFPTGTGGSTGGSGGSAINQYAAFHVLPKGTLFTGVFNSATNRMQLPSDYESSTSGAVTVPFTFYSLAGVWLGSYSTTANQGQGTNNWNIVDFVNLNPGVLVNGTSYYVDKSINTNAAFTTNLNTTTGIYKPLNSTDEYIRTGKTILKGSDYPDATVTGQETILNGRTSAVPGVDANNTNSVGAQLDFKVVYGNGGFWRFNWVGNTAGTFARGDITFRALESKSFVATPLVLTGTTWTEGTPITIMEGNGTTLVNRPGFVDNGTTDTFQIFDVAWDDFNSKWAFMMRSINATSLTRFDINLTDVNFQNASGNEQFVTTPTRQTNTALPQVLTVNPVNGEFLILRSTTDQTAGRFYIFDGTSFTQDATNASKPVTGIDSSGHVFNTIGIGSTRSIQRSNNALTSPGQTLDLADSQFTLYYAYPATVSPLPTPTLTQGDIFIFNGNSLNLLMSDFTTFNIPDTSIAAAGQNIDSDVPLVGDPTIQTPDPAQSGLTTTPLSQTVFLKIK